VIVLREVLGLPYQGNGKHGVFTQTNKKQDKQHKTANPQAKKLQGKVAMYICPKTELNPSPPTRKGRRGILSRKPGS